MINNNYRKAYIYVSGTFAGELVEKDYGYSFIYDNEYLQYNVAKLPKMFHIMSQNLIIYFI